MMKSKKAITIYTTTLIDNYRRLSWFRQTLETFYDCTGEQHDFFQHIVIDDSPSPFREQIATLCDQYSIMLLPDFCKNHRVWYGGIWNYILDTCESPLFMFLLDDIISIQKQDYLESCIKAFGAHSDLYLIYLQCVFSAWTKEQGSPIYHTKRFYEVCDGFVETVHGTRLYPHPIDSENTLWKTSLSDRYRGVGERFSLNHTILRRDIVSRLQVLSPHWISARRRGKRLWSWLLGLKGSRLVVEPADLERLFAGAEIDQRYNTGYLNMQTFSYTPDHQPMGIEDKEEFKRINCARLLDLPGRQILSPCRR